MFIQFSCKRCGFCCHGETTVSLDPADQHRMLEYLQISKDEALKLYWRSSGSQIQMKTIGGHCIFYKDGCTVHPARPWRCREWPFVKAITVDKKNLDTIRASCPGINKATSYDEICRYINDGGCLGEKDIDNNGEDIQR